MGRRDLGKLGQWGKGAMGQWDIGQGDTGEVNTGHVDNGQCHNAQWDYGAIGPWDNRQWNNGPMTNETMDIGIVGIRTPRSGTMDNGTVGQALRACVADINVDASTLKHGPTRARTTDLMLMSRTLKLTYENR
jgi:hypothetical protein